MQHDTHSTHTPADERLSALFDGEIDNLDRDATHPGTAERWRGYALISDVLRGDGQATRPFMQRMEAALAEEPAVLAPLPRKRTISTPMRWLAAAASLTAISWLLFNGLAPEAGRPVVAESLVAQNDARSAPVPDEASEVMSYLDAHQDYAHAVMTAHDMRFSPITVAEAAP
jgi:negative regulator of sigma E activity